MPEITIFLLKNRGCKGKLIHAFRHLRQVFTYLILTVYKVIVCTWTRWRGFFWLSETWERNGHLTHPEVAIHNKTDETCILSTCSLYDYKRISGAYWTIEFISRHIHSWMATHTEMSLTSWVYSNDWCSSFYIGSFWKVYVMYISEL